MTCWMGVDVGGQRKGFDVAVIGDGRVLALRDRLTRADVLDLITAFSPAVTGIDSPGHCAPPGSSARADERALARSVCGIRWTPDEQHVRASAYYDWVVAGLGLFGAVAGLGAEAVEVFPTASWTRWHGPRGTRSRAAWSIAGLAALGLEGVPGRTNQDQRDAIAAAVTARQHSLGLTERFGDIVVPAGPWSAGPAGIAP
jgi:predicted nuclease with RNAse H fold